MTLMTYKTSILFFLPRFHTNLIGLTDGLINEGCSVHMFCLRKYSIEDYKSITPILIPRLRLFSSKNFFLKENHLDFLIYLQ